MACVEYKPDRRFPYYTLQCWGHFASIKNFQEIVLFQDYMNAFHPYVPHITAK